MELFALADDTVLSIFNSLFQLLGTVFAGIMAYYMAKLNNKAKEAATAVKDVADKADASATVVVQKLTDITAATEVTNDLIRKQ